MIGWFEFSRSSYWVYCWVYFYLLLSGSQLLGIGQVVDSDGQENVEQSVIAKESENDKVQRVNHARAMSALRLDPLVHDFVPVFAGEHLEHGQKGDGEGVEIRGWRAVGEVEGSAKELHAQQGENEDEEEQEKKEGNNGAHGAKEGYDKVA